ncbi:MAG: hypothetical protein ACKVU1_03620 [bacterium]
MHKNPMAAALVIGSVVAALTAGVGAGVRPVAAANVINVEFNFTPYVGDAATDDEVQTVAGMARVFINNIPYAVQEVTEQELPVLFDEREISPSVWLPVESCGGALRKGKNTLRIEFEPKSASKAYRARLAWASVMDESTEEGSDGSYSSTNMSDAGVDDKEAKGKVVFEREFMADFAADMPWHHYAAVTALTDADKKALTALVAQRIEMFKPDFAAFYALLEANTEMDITGMKEAKCLDAAYAAGARIAAPKPADLDIVTTGGPAVVIRAKDGNLFVPEDMSAFEKIEDPEIQMCIGMAFATAFPPQIVVVRAPSGAWEAAY